MGVTTDRPVTFCPGCILSLSKGPGHVVRSGGGVDGGDGSYELRITSYELGKGERSC